LSTLDTSLKLLKLLIVSYYLVPRTIETVFQADAGYNPFTKITWW